MTRYLVHCKTYFCGGDNTYAIELDNHQVVDNYAYDIAYDNFFSYFGVDDIAEHEYLDIDNPDDLEKCEELIDDYIDYEVEEFIGTDEEWNTYEKR